MRPGPLRTHAGLCAGSCTRSCTRAVALYAPGVPPARAARDPRKQTGAWYTPAELVDTMVTAVVDAGFVDRRASGARRLRVLDPACGDGRFLVAVGERLAGFGVEVDLVGVDVDPAAVDELARRCPRIDVTRADALTHEWPAERFDLVIGNPPFLSQMSAATARGGSSRHGGGPYADAAVEFLALASELVDPDGGRLAFVLPQSVLSARDAAPVRAAIDRRASMVWSWWTAERVFDAQVYTCAVAFEFGPRSTVGDAGADAAPSGAGAPDGRGDAAWSHVVADRHGVPGVPPSSTRGTLADRARLNANFRDEYYGMVPAVDDHPSGPPLVTSGLIDPGRSWWGTRSVTFARRRLHRPRVDLDALDPKMRRWAENRLVPKVLVANQTSIVEAVADPAGAWLPAVPVVAAYPVGVTDPAAAATEIAAVLTSPWASAWVWQRTAGTGLSAGAVRLGPVLLGALPWPAGDVGPAVEALRLGDVRACGRAVLDAYGVSGDAGRSLVDWWEAALLRIEARQPSSRP